VVGAAWFINAPESMNKSFVDRYTKKFGGAPDQFAAQAYAAAQVVTQLVRDGASTPAELCNGMKNLKTAQTVLGPISFEANRDVKGAPAILKLVSNGFAIF
jgi:branched-chain amino acid transport system substrate-binding protein